jgi:indolepyruvate ferredoxin oxidoreductase beta subunit
MSATYNIMFVGVGGQGLMLITQILGQAAVDSGLTVLTGEQHGLSQRSGSIYVHFRIGDPISPLIPYGRAHMMVAMEATETLRYLEYLKDDGVVVMSGRVIHPVGETQEVALDAKKQYLRLDQIVEKLRQVTKNLIVLDSVGLATEVGNPRAENSVLLGAACATEDFPVSVEATNQAVLSLVPKKTIEANAKAFDLGLEAGRKALTQAKQAHSKAE